MDNPSVLEDSERRDSAWPSLLRQGARSHTSLEGGLQGVLQGNSALTDLSKHPTGRGVRMSGNHGLTEKGYARVVVEHNYVDHASPEMAANKLSSIQQRRGRVGSFPARLHAMLERAEEDGFHCIVSWQPHGRAFRVHDHDTFVAEVMPRFFRHKKFSSFQRQLSLYGFLRLLKKGSDHGAYYHELCLRGMPELVRGMQRVANKGISIRTASNPHEEPNFFMMRPVGVQNGSAPSSRTTQKRSISAPSSPSDCSRLLLDRSLSALSLPEHFSNRTSLYYGWEPGAPHTQPGSRDMFYTEQESGTYPGYELPSFGPPEMSYGLAYRPCSSFDAEMDRAAPEREHMIAFLRDVDLSEEDTGSEED